MFSNVCKYPVTEFKICKFATYLSNILKTVQSIKAYCTAVCDKHELQGYKPVKKGIKFFRAIVGIRRNLRHTVKRVQPMTVELLKEIETVVNLQHQKEMVVWVTAVSGFHMVLRKSNLVPLKRVHDKLHNITRRDIRYSKGVMMVMVRWSKMNQHGDVPQEILMMANKHSTICPVRWILYMLNTVEAAPHHNLFSFTGRDGPSLVTYRDLIMYLHKWLDLLGKDSKKYSSHSLCRGATTHAHNKQISECSIQDMGFWRSDCYKRYIDVDMRSRIDRWFKFNN